jgi:predicted Zn-dependent protease
VRGAWERLRAWRHRHPLRAAAVLIVLAALAGGAGYQIGSHLWTRGHFRAAREALDRHDWAEARAHLEACLRRWPDDPTVRLLAARAARRLERLDEAQAYLDACQRLSGGETQAAQVERALLRVHRGDLAGTEDFLRSCVARDDPDAVEILDVLSAALILNYRVAEAQQCLDDLLRRQPDHFHALVRRAWTAQSSARYGEAVGYFEKALALRPDADTLRLALAEVQVALGRFANAREHFERLRRSQPENPSVRFGLARCLAGTGQPEEAQQLVDRLLTDYPDDWKALSERGGLALQLGRPEEAENYLRRAVVRAPPDLPTLTRLTDCLRLLGKPDEARTYQAEADRLKADFQQAEHLGNLIREQRPHDPALRYELGCLLLRLGKSQDGLHWLQTALKEDPRHRPTHEALAEFYEKAGQPGLAAPHRRFLEQAGAAPVGSHSAGYPCP